MTEYKEVADYICSQWDRAVRCSNLAPNEIPVPVPHTVASPDGKFHVLFYWDTYFSNLGLLRCGRVDLARSNCDALLWWIDLLGFVPNSAFIGDQNRSQPPFLAQMVREVYDFEKDLKWLSKALPRLKKEHAFWSKKRTFPNIGLAFHGHHADDEYLIKFYNGLCHRRLKLGLDVPDNIKVEVAGQLLAEAESGRDFNPFSRHRTLYYADVELNTLIFLIEDNIAYFCRELGLSNEVSEWEERAHHRAIQIDKVLWDGKTGLYRARDLVWQEFNEIAHGGTFYPLWAGLASREQAARVYANLHLLENDHGIAQTEPYGDELYQWAYPNGWPPTQWIVVGGLLRYGYHEAAVRIARKYCDLQKKMFSQTGTLWEKFNVVNGDFGIGEYDPDPMLGWTAGVFMEMLAVLQKHAEE